MPPQIVTETRYDPNVSICQNNSKHFAPTVHFPLERATIQPSCKNDVTLTLYLHIWAPAFHQYCLLVCGGPIFHQLSAYWAYLIVRGQNALSSVDLSHLIAQRAETSRVIFQLEQMTSQWDDPPLKKSFFFLCHCTPLPSKYQLAETARWREVSVSASRWATDAFKFLIRHSNEVDGVGACLLSQDSRVQLILHMTQHSWQNLTQLLASYCCVMQPWGARAELIFQRSRSSAVNFIICRAQKFSQQKSHSERVDCCSKIYERVEQIWRLSRNLERRM